MKPKIVLVLAFIFKSVRKGMYPYTGGKKLFNELWLQDFHLCTHKENQELLLWSKLCIA